MRILIISLMSASLSACVSYADPMSLSTNRVVGRTLVTDSAKRESGSRVHLFYLKSVNGQVIEHAENATRSHNYGKGMVVEPITPSRYVPSDQVLDYEICAQTYNGAPILSLLRKDANKCEVVQSKLLADKEYIVSGVIDGANASVKLEQSSGPSALKTIEKEL